MASIFDGVLGDFNTPYIALIKKHTGISLPPVSDTYPNTWNYERAAGVEKSRENAMWQEIKNSTTFWMELPVLPGAHEAMEYFYDRLSPEDAVYFITSRQGNNCKGQTEKWLSTIFNIKNPTVLISRHKGLACAALNLSHYVDDKVENIEDVLRDSPKTEAYLLDAPWNRHNRDLPRLYNLLDFFKVVLA